MILWMIRIFRKDDFLDYNDLLEEAAASGLIVKEKRLRAYDGRIKGNRVAIRKDMPTVQKTCVLAEELGHKETGYGNILGQDTLLDIKQEYRARMWAFDKLIGLTGIIKAYKRGCTSLHEVSEFLDVTEEFLLESLVAYRRRYGCHATVDNYIICFEPALGVLEMI